MHKLPFSIGLSTFFHIIAILSLSLLNNAPERKLLKPAEITFIKTKPLNPQTIKKSSSSIPIRKTLDLNRVGLGQKIILSNKDKIPEAATPSFANAKEQSIESRNISKPVLSRMDLPPKSEIKLTSGEIDSSDKLSQTPVYLTYSNFLRESIRRCLYNKFSLINDKGLVCLKFALSADGRLLEYRIVEEKSNASDKLKSMAIEGLQDAAPFPSLPEELSSQAATFSVVIHFIDEKPGVKDN